MKTQHVKMCVLMHVDTDVISDWSVSVINASRLWYKSERVSHTSGLRPWEPEKTSKHNLWPQELLNGLNKAAAHVSAINIWLVFFYKVTGWHFTLDIGHKQTNSQKMTNNSIFISTQRWSKSLESLTRHRRHACIKLTFTCKE